MLVAGIVRQNGARHSLRCRRPAEGDDVVIVTTDTTCTPLRDIVK